MNPAPEIYCFCNNVTRSQVEDAIQQGAKSLREIHERTSAGVGPCGGSCRELLKSVLATGAPPSLTTGDWQAPQELVEAVSLFNRRYYWETHEVLEKVWMDEHGPSRLFYQGIIQAAAALYHVLNANPQGALKLGQEALNKLAAYRPAYHNVKIELLCRRLQEYVEQAKEMLGRTRPSFDYDRLPVILIGNDMKVGENA